jgi:hypothetical protein
LRNAGPCRAPLDCRRQRLGLFVMRRLAAIARKPTATARQRPSNGRCRLPWPRVSHPLVGASGRRRHWRCMAGGPTVVGRLLRADRQMPRGLCQRQGSFRVWDPNDVTGFSAQSGPQFDTKRMQLLKDSVQPLSRGAFLGIQSDWESPTVSRGARHSRAAERKKAPEEMEREGPPGQWRGSAPVLRAQVERGSTRGILTVSGDGGMTCKSINRQWCVSAEKSLNSCS